MIKNSDRNGKKKSKRNLVLLNFVIKLNPLLDRRSALQGKTRFAWNNFAQFKYVRVYNETALARKGWWMKE